MRYGKTVLAGVICAVSVSVAAQDIVMFDAAPALDEQKMDVVGFDPLNLGPIVSNAPYSAEAVTEFSQTLADGNRIERRTTGKVARNSQGRVRREQQGISFGPFVADNARPMVTIADPKSGQHLMLNYDLKVAFRTTLPRMTVKVEPDQAVAGPVFGSVSAGTVAIGRGGMMAAPPIDALRVDPANDVEAPSITIAARPPMIAEPFDGDVKTETLEPKQIEGLRVEGTRTTMTLPAGAVGNVLPIEIVSERWYSLELKIVLYTRRSDPRFGETIYRLTNIDRSEPPPDLFKMPQGFKTEEIKPGMPLLPKLREQWQ